MTRRRAEVEEPRFKPEVWEREAATETQFARIEQLAVWRYSNGAYAFDEAKRQWVTDTLAEARREKNMTKREAYELITKMGGKIYHQRPELDDMRASRQPKIPAHIPDGQEHRRDLFG